MYYAYTYAYTRLRYFPSYKIVSHELTHIPFIKGVGSKLITLSLYWMSINEGKQRKTLPNNILPLFRCLYHMKWMTLL